MSSENTCAGQYEWRVPQELADLFERRPFLDELDRRNAAVNGPDGADGPNFRFEHGLTPAESSGSDGAMTGTRLAPRLETGEILTMIDPAPRRVRPRGTAHETAARVRIKRLLLDPQ